MINFLTSSDIPVGSSGQLQTSSAESSPLQSMIPIDASNSIITFTTPLGNIGLIFQGFKFNRRGVAKSSVHWNCSKRRRGGSKHGCKASLTTSHGPPFIYKKHKHSHTCNKPHSNSGLFQLYIQGGPYVALHCVVVFCS